MQHGARQHVVEWDPQEAGQGQDAAGRQFPEVGGHPGEQPTGYRAQPATTVDAGLRGRRGHRLEAEFLTQPDRLGPGREQGFRTGVEAEPTETLQGQLATEPFRRLEQRDRRPGAVRTLGQVPRRGQTADPTTDDNHMWERLHDPPWNGSPNSCTARTAAVTLSAGVSGSTP